MTRATAPEKAPALVRGPIETDAERLLARARAKAARGDYSGALTDLPRRAAAPSRPGTV